MKTNLELALFCFVAAVSVFLVGMAVGKLLLLH